MCQTLNTGRGYWDHTQTNNGATRLLFRADLEYFKLYSIASFKRVTPVDGLISRNIYIECFYCFNFLILT